MFQKFEKILNNSRVYHEEHTGSRDHLPSCTGYHVPFLRIVQPLSGVGHLTASRYNVKGRI